MASTEPLLFPYMVWAHEESFASPFGLAHSGMPTADPALFAEGFALDVGHPCSEAQPALERELALRFGVPPSRVLVTLGASAAMLIVALRFFRGGARVVTEVPSYEPFRALPRLLGGEPGLAVRRPRTRWRLDPGEVEHLLSLGGTPGHVFVCTPHNPTGAVLEREDLVELARLAESRGGVLISNEVYMEFAPPGERFHAFSLAPNAISIGSLTKAYGLGALRIGWMVLGEGLEGERPGIVDGTYLAYVDPPTPSLRAALLALRRSEELLAPLRRLERDSRPLLARWLEETPGIEGSLGPFGLSAFPRIEGVDDTRDLQRHLAREHGVDAVAGEFFGLAGHLRIGFGLDPDDLTEGLGRLARGIETFRGRTRRP